MSDQNSAGPQFPAGPPRWQAIGPIDRRVAGVLVEKAKTTPSGYPMSLNAIRTACNQKSNRAPMMDLSAEDVEEALERLRHLGAVGMIEGQGRVSKYRHYLYEWLRADKIELAVMAELFLRGAQTEGELRARAARMEPIADLAALRPVLDSLKSKGLVIGLTPEGRGHVVTHALCMPREMEGLRAEYGRGAVAGSATAHGQPESGPPPDDVPLQPRVPQPADGGPQAAELEPLRRQVEELRLQADQLRSDLEALADRQEQTDERLGELRDMLGG
jgi:uncharacterized protein YceH (UPF0502 family)